MIGLQQAFLNTFKVIIVTIIKAYIFNFGDFDESMLLDNIFAVTIGVFFADGRLLRKLVHRLLRLLLGAEILAFFGLSIQLGLYGLDLI